MISLKIPKLFLALAKSSKSTLCPRRHKLRTAQEWAVIEKDVRSKNGRRGIQGALEAIIFRTGIALEEAAGELSRRAQDNRRIGTRVCVTDIQMDYVTAATIWYPRSQRRSFASASAEGYVGEKYIE
jgi:hypothetical protein